MNFADELKTKFDLFEVPKLKQTLTVNIRAYVSGYQILVGLFIICVYKCLITVLNFIFLQCSRVNCRSLILNFKTCNIPRHDNTINSLNAKYEKTMLNI